MDVYACVRVVYLHFTTCFLPLFLRIHIKEANAQAPATVRLDTNLLRAGAILSVARKRLKI